MADVVIERCIVRVVRHGGWRWGSEPQRVIDAVTRVVPALVARHLAELWPEEVEGEIAAPQKVSLTLTLAELLSLIEPLPGSDAIGIVEQSLAEAAVTLADKVQLARCVPGARAPAASEVARTHTPPSWGGTVLRVLLGWRAQGQLRGLLDAFTVGALESWAREVFVAAGHSSPSLDQVPSPEEIDRVMAVATAEPPAALRRDEPVPLREYRERLRNRLLAAVEFAAAWELPPWHPVVADVIARRFPEPARDGSVEADAGGAPPLEARPASPGIPPVAPPVLRPTRAECRECAALPFLLLAPLAQMGWLQAVGAALAGRNQGTELAALAAALAFKVLPPPERGWRRSEPALTSAAAFAGFAMSDDSAIARLAERASDLFSPLDALLARAVVAGHTAGRPLLVHRPGNGEALVLVDCEGLFPLGWTGGATALGELMAPLRHEILLVASQAANPAVIRELTAREISFVTDARPGRHEAWRMIRGRHGTRFWTNDHRADETDLFAAAARFSDDAAEVGALWHALAESRPSAPRSPAAFEHSLTVAAAVALGFLAWTLWRKREPAHPRLALERFADFSARVVIGPETVDVRLPLGPRHSDLLAHGLLDDVSGVPWFGERTVRFFGG
jgi:hypothetical protein